MWLMPSESAYHQVNMSPGLVERLEIKVFVRTLLVDAPEQSCPVLEEIERPEIYDGLSILVFQEL